MTTRVCCMSLFLVGGLSLALPAQDTSSTDGLNLEMAQEWMKFLTGEWDVKSKMWSQSSDWEESQATEAVESVAGGGALITRATSPAASEVVLTTWDPGEATMVQYGVSSLGYTWTTKAVKITDKVVESEMTGALPDGSTGTGTSKIEKTGPDSFTVTWSVSVDGEEFAKGSQENTKKKADPSRPGRPSLGGKTR